MKTRVFVWRYLFIIISGAGALISLFVVIQLRAIVISLQKGMSFTQDNSQRIKKIGMVVLAWNALHPFLQYFAWGSIIKGISFNTQGFELYPAFEVNFMGLLIGAMLILLSSARPKNEVLHMNPDSCRNSNLKNVKFHRFEAKTNYDHSKS